jgi:hypothetical protein
MLYFLITVAAIAAFTQWRAGVREAQAVISHPPANEMISPWDSPTC